jgi:acetoin utilization deacetylase AcuC-like enzyme
MCFNHGGSDAEEIRNVEREVPRRLKEFKPEMIYWLCGFDTHQDSYGTQALTAKAYAKMAKIIKGAADEVCGGKLIVKTCFNAPPHATEYAAPRLVNCLSEMNKFPED